MIKKWNRFYFSMGRRQKNRTGSIFLALVLAGCGYTTHSALPGNLRTVYVKPFINKIDITTEVTDRSRYKIYRPLLESQISNTIISAFQADGHLRVASPQRADAVLMGELLDFRRDALRYDRNNNVEEYRLSIVVNLELRDAHSGQVIWDEQSFIGDTTFFVTGALAEVEPPALDRAVKDLARRVVERTVEGW